jgi:hypothetical protein
VTKLTGRPCSDPPRATVTTPRLLVILEPEELIVVRVEAATFGDELRLADELRSRGTSRLAREIADAVGEALDLLDRRRQIAVPADLSATFAEAA